MNPIALLSLAVSLAVIWIYANLVQRRPSFEMVVLYTSSTFMALVAVIFNVFWMFGFEGECVILALVSFLLLCFALVARKYYYPKESIIESLSQDFRERQNTLSLFTVLIPAFLLYLYPSLPLLLPPGWNVDGGSHLATANLVLRSLEKSMNPQLFVVNSFGFHVNVGLIARAFGTPVELTIYPFVSFVGGLLVYSCYAWARKVALLSKSCAALACFILATSNPIVNLVAIDVSWAVLLSLFMISVSILILSEKRFPAPSRAMAVAPLVVGNIFVYALFGGFILIFLLLLLLWRRSRLKESLLSLCIIAVSTGLSYAFFINNSVWRVAASSMQYIVLPDVTRFYYADWLGIVPLFLFLLVIRRSMFKKHPTPFVFVLSVGVYAALFIGLSKILVPGTYFPYFLLKMSYLLPLPISVLSGLSLDQLARARSLGFANRPHPTYYLDRRKLLKLTSSVLILIIAVGSCSEAYLHLTNSRWSGYGLLVNPPVPISPEQYRMAIWTRSNLNNHTITLSGNSPSTLYFCGIIISDWGNFTFENKYADREWWMKPPISFDEWNKSSSDGDIIASLQGKDFWGFYLPRMQPNVLVLNSSLADTKTNRGNIYLDWDISDDLKQKSFTNSNILSVPMFKVDLPGLSPKSVELTDGKGEQVRYVIRSYSDNLVTFGAESNDITRHPEERIINVTALIKIRIVVEKTETVKDTRDMITLRLVGPRRLVGFTILFENDETIVVKKNNR